MACCISLRTDVSRHGSQAQRAANTRITNSTSDERSRRGHDGVKVSRGVARHARIQTSRVPQMPVAAAMKYDRVRGCFVILLADLTTRSHMAAAHANQTAILMNMYVALRSMLDIVPCPTSSDLVTETANLAPGVRQRHNAAPSPLSQTLA